MDDCFLPDHDVQNCHRCSPLNAAIWALERGELPARLADGELGPREAWLCLEWVLLTGPHLLGVTPPALAALLALGDAAARLPRLLGAVAQRASAPGASLEPLLALWRQLLEAGADPALPCRYRVELRTEPPQVVWETREVVRILFPPGAGGGPAPRALLAVLLEMPGGVLPPDAEAFLRNEAGDSEAADLVHAAGP